MDVTIAKADGSNGVRYTIEASSLLLHAPNLSVDFDHIYSVFGSNKFGERMSLSQDVKNVRVFGGIGQDVGVDAAGRCLPGRG